MKKEWEEEPLISTKRKKNLKRGVGRKEKRLVGKLESQGFRDW
jgi:hypothetical protein